MGTAPTISVEKTDGCQMFLSGDSLGVNIISSKSSEMNVMIPGAEEFVEVAVPEQFRTTVTGTSLQTTPLDRNQFGEVMFWEEILSLSNVPQLFKTNVWDDWN